MTKHLRQLNRHLLELLILLFLIVATFAVFWQVQNQEFVNYDDNVYITENPHVQSGLTRKSLAWAFTSTYASNWHPLTWLSHMLDCQIYGLDCQQLCGTLQPRKSLRWAWTLQGRV